MLIFGQFQKQLCTIYKKEVTGQDDNSSEATFSDLSDEEMNKFVERWMAFETTQTSQSFVSLTCTEDNLRFFI